MRELREQDTYKFNEIPGYTGTVQEIAKKINEHANSLGWIPDRVELGCTAPLSNAEFKKLVDLLRDIDSTEADDLNKDRIKSSELASPDEFSDLVKKEENIKNELKDFQDYSKDHRFQTLLDVNFDIRKSALDAITALRMAIDDGLRRPFPWLENTVRDILADQDQPLKKLYDVTKSRMQGLNEKTQIVDDYHVKLPNRDKAEIRASVQDLLSFLKSGKTIWPWPFQNRLIRETKYLWSETYIDGRKCDNIVSLEKLSDLLHVDMKINQIWNDWADKTDRIQGSYVSQLAHLSEQLEALECAIKIERPLSECKRLIQELSVISEPKWHQSVELAELERRFKAALVFETQKEIKGQITKLENQIRHYVNEKNSHPINNELMQALLERDLDTWTKAFHKLSDLETRRKLLAERELYLECLKESAFELEEEIINKCHDLIWDERYQSFEGAWSWSLADTWLQDYEAKHDSEKLNSSFVTLQQRIWKTTATLCSCMAWDHCFKTMNNEQRTALLAWQNAVRRIGSGKRKGSAQAQKDAEKHMKKCRETIPAWVMPLYRVC